MRFLIGVFSVLHGLVHLFYFGWFINSAIALTLIIVLSACGATSLPGPPTAHEPGQLAEADDVFGAFYAYVPTSVPESPEILVLVHGTPPKDETAEWNAQYYANNWIDFAEKHGYEVPKVLDAFYGDNPGKQNQEMYALQSGALETSFDANFQMLSSPGVGYNF